MAREMTLEILLEMYGYIVGKKTQLDVYIKCPLCEDDPSFHLGINKMTGNWGCWRNELHRGRGFKGLFRKLGIPEGLEPDADRKSVEFTPPLVAGIDGLREWDDSRNCQRFKQYLINRGIQPADAIKYYWKWCLTGPAAFRIMIPVIEDGNILTWTGRAIDGRDPRYLSLSKFKAPEVTANCLYNSDSPLKDGGDSLFVVEGPFDAMSLEVKAGQRAVAIMGKRLQDIQQYKLLKLAKSFKQIVFWLDKDARSAQLRMIKKCQSHGVHAISCWYDKVKDAGELSGSLVDDFKNNWRTYGSERAST